MAIPDEKKKTPEKTPVEKQPRQDDKAIDNRLKAAFGSGVASSGSKGDASQGSGVQGNPFGATPDGELQGVGGYGGYSLAGRGLLGELPRPQYDSSNDAGTIVVDIVVDARGRVTDARIRVSGSEGSAASNANLRRSAVEAARKASFEAVAKAGNQQGYIVYYFRDSACGARSVAQEREQFPPVIFVDVAIVVDGCTVDNRANNCRGECVPLKRRPPASRHNLVAGDGVSFLWRHNHYVGIITFSQEAAVFYAEQ